MKKYLLLFLTGMAVKTHAQNLVVNPGFEQSLSTGWTIVSGNWDQTGSGYGYGDPNNGNYYATPRFISGAKEMYQEVDVSSYAAAIDNGTGGFSFEAYLQVASNGDTAQAITEYRNTGGTVLAADTLVEYVSQFNVWNLKTKNRVAPAGTRSIRIRLLAVPFSGFGDLIMFDDISLTATTTLPLQLVYFTAKAGREHAVIEWQTADETDAPVFRIQGSTNGLSFTTLSTIAGRGNNRNAYKIELPLNNGWVYYRLEITHRSGAISYSSIEKIGMAGAVSFLLYPNPATATITLLPSGLNGQGSAYIYNSNGKLVVTIELYGAAKTIDVSQWPNGLYTVQVRAGIQRTNATFIINH